MLLPPSEGKAAGGTSRRWTTNSGTFASLAARRDEVVAALVQVDGGSEKLLGVKGDHLERALSANVAVDGARSLPAWQRYTGVVWDHLDPASMPTSDLRRLVVVSALLGLARGNDPVPDYRLKMGANLPSLGKLSTWWREDLSDALNRYASGRTGGRRRVIVDLLAKEHRAAWTPDHRVHGVSIEFVDPTGKPGGHFAKAAKGALARAILADGVGVVDEWSDDRFELRVDPIS